MPLRFSLRLLVFLALLPAGLMAQQLLPFVENFTKADYAGDNQNWSIVQGGDNALYFANNHYLLRYNGVRWERKELPDKTIIRSLLWHNGRLYSGSYREFGYWQRKDGNMTYRSLTAGSNLFSGISGNEEIWKIFRFAGALYFQSFNDLFRYEGGKITKVRFPHQISYCYVVGNALYAATVREGVYRIKGSNFEYQPQWAALRGTVIHGMEQVGDGLYFFTKDRGIFVWRNGSLGEWRHPLAARLKQEVILSAKSVRGALVIGTSLSGVYHVDLKSGRYINLNRGNALLNNAVLSICSDKEHDLWLGLDNGITHIEIHSDVSVYSDASGLLGSVYAVKPAGGEGYLMATNHGLFGLNAGRLGAIAGSQGQVWSIFGSQAGTVIGHNDGTFLYRNGVLSQVNPVTGGWKFLQSPFEKVLFQAHYGGVVYYPDPSNLAVYANLEGLAKPIRNIAQVRPGELWAVDNYRGLYRLLFDKDFKVRKVENVAQQSGIEHDFNVKLFPYRGSLYFLLSGKWYTFDAVSGKLTPDVLFNLNFPGVTDVCPVDDDHFIIKIQDVLYVVSQSGDAFSSRLIPQKYYEGRLIADNLDVSRVDGGLLVNLDDGFFRYEWRPEVPLRQKLTIEASFEGNFLHQGGRVPYNETVILQIIPQYYGFGRPEFFYTLDDGKYQRVEKGSIALSNLESGTRKVTVYHFDGKTYGRAGVFHFGVGPPWYLSGWMILLYVAVIGGLFFLYYRWNAIRYAQKVALLDEQMRHDRDLMQLQLKGENLQRMQEYQRQILELELQNKSSEVAGKSLSIAKQTEIINKIEQILNREEDVDTIRHEIRKAIRINEINRHEWETFEANLNQLHDSFIARLTERYPKLTPKDIKLCIYLRMNLSSKEIAPLMNISFRSVELQRYRLRAKLGISKEENLTRLMLSI